MTENFFKIENQFVEVYNQEHNRVVFTGLITGFVVGFGGIGVQADVYDLKESVQRVVGFEHLRVIGAESIYKGLEGLCAYQPDFGYGIISDERRTAKIMEVRLRDTKGFYSYWYPLYEVTVFGPQSCQMVPVLRFD